MWRLELCCSSEDGGFGAAPFMWFGSAVVLLQIAYWEVKVRTIGGIDSSVSRGWVELCWCQGGARLATFFSKMWSVLGIHGLYVLETASTECERITSTEAVGCVAELGRSKPPQTAMAIQSHRDLEGKMNGGGTVAVLLDSRLRAPNLISAPNDVVCPSVASGVRVNEVLGLGCPSN